MRVQDPNTVFASSLAPPSSNQNQSPSIRDKKPTILIKMAVLGCMKVQTISSPIGYSRIIICMYVCMYIHTLTQAHQDLPSSRHPVKDGLKKSHTALPDKCDCYSTVVSIHTEMKTQTTGRVSNSRRKERGISIMQILLCSLYLLCFTS